MIPKTIHAVWYGSVLPCEIVARMEAWKRILPGYQIKIWGQEESPRHLSYFHNAIKGRHWANASNLMRLWILYCEGGIYLDTDIDLVRSFDPLLVEDAFVGFQSSPGPGEFLVNNAVLGAVQAHPFIEDCLSMLLSEFDGTERADLSSPLLTTRVLLAHGLVHYGDQHLYGGKLRLCDSEAFYPYSYMDDPKEKNSMVTDKTYTIHRWHISWSPPHPTVWEQRLVRVLSGLLLHIDRFLRTLGDSWPRLRRIRTALRKQLLHKQVGGERRVMSGLFAGMQFVSLEHTGSSMEPKLLGTYEFSVQQVLAGWAARDYQVIYNVGCECGTMLMGLATIFPQAELIGYDVNSRACASAKQNLEAVSDRVKILNREFNWGDLDGTKARSLMLCDIEGGEGPLFESSRGKLPNDIIIEIHEFVDPGLLINLSKLLGVTHKVRIIRETLPPVSALRNLDSISAADLGDFSDEHRPIHMCWLVAERSQQ